MANWFTKLMGVVDKAAPIVIGVAKETAPMIPGVGQAAQGAITLAPVILGIVQAVVGGIQKAHEAATQTPDVAHGLPGAGIPGDVRKSLALSILPYLLQVEFHRHGREVPQAVIDGLPDQIERSLASLKYMSEVVGALKDPLLEPGK